MDGESDVTRSIIDELHSSHMQRDQMADESGVTRSIIDELHSSDIHGDQMEGESGVTQSIVDELDSWYIQEMKWKLKVVLLEVSSMNFILRISKAIKWNVKPWCYSKYHR